MDNGSINGDSDQNRNERDSLGDVQVPNSALYGAQTARAIRNFPITGLATTPDAGKSNRARQARRSRSQSRPRRAMTLSEQTQS